jgi:hypothetical protein
MDKIKYGVQLNCSHKFCFVCIKAVMETNGLCPLCRRDIDIDINKLCISDIKDFSPKTEIFPCTKWLYSSKDRTSWWFYEDETTDTIEKCFSSNSPCTISFGVHIYKIDFSQMLQLGQNTERKIQRIVFNNKQEFDDFIKSNTRGIAGLYFKKKH